MIGAGCIEWWDIVGDHGYGLKSEKQKARRAHRFVYEECFGPLPKGIILHHKCGNKICVNPFHLEPISRALHNHEHGRMITHCPRGHPYDAQNTYYNRHKKTGWVTRRCRACNREKEAEKRMLANGD